MNTNSTVPEFLTAFVRDLREHLGCCETALALATEENRALNGASEFQLLDFQEQRKRLVSVLDSSLLRLRTWRQTWQQFSSDDRERCAEVKPLFQKIQDLLMRVLVLDRENQQALLRRGLVPPQHLSLAAGPQPPHYVANLYRRNVAAG